MLLSGPVCIVICVMVVKLFGAHSGLEANVSNVFCYILEHLHAMEGCQTILLAVIKGIW